MSQAIKGIPTDIDSVSNGLASGLDRVCSRQDGFLAVEQEATLNALAVEAFNDLLKKHGKRQNVENPLLD